MTRKLDLISKLTLTNVITIKTIIIKRKTLTVAAIMVKTNIKMVLECKPRINICSYNKLETSLNQF
jgi:hypothetical protein